MCIKDVLLARATKSLVPHLERLHKMGIWKKHCNWNNLNDPDCVLSTVPDPVLKLASNLNVLLSDRL